MGQEPNNKNAEPWYSYQRTAELGKLMEEGLRMGTQAGRVLIAKKQGHRRAQMQKSQSQNINKKKNCSSKINWNKSLGI